MEGRAAGTGDRQVFLTSPLVKTEGGTVARAVVPFFLGSLPGCASFAQIFSYQGRDRTQALMPPIPMESLPARPGGAGVGWSKT